VTLLAAVEILPVILPTEIISLPFFKLKFSNDLNLMSAL
jgi:hypothetical protein